MKGGSWVRLLWFKGLIAELENCVFTSEVGPSSDEGRSRWIDGRPQAQREKQVDKQIAIFHIESGTKWSWSPRDFWALSVCPSMIRTPNVKYHNFNLSDNCPFLYGVEVSELHIFPWSGVYDKFLELVYLLLF